MAGNSRWVGRARAFEPFSRTGQVGPAPDDLSEACAVSFKPTVGPAAQAGGYIDFEARAPKACISALATTAPDCAR